MRNLPVPGTKAKRWFGASESPLMLDCLFDFGNDRRHLGCEGLLGIDAQLWNARGPRLSLSTLPLVDVVPGLGSVFTNLLAATNSFQRDSWGTDAFDSEKSALRIAGKGTSGEDLVSLGESAIEDHGDTFGV